MWKHFFFFLTSLTFIFLFIFLCLNTKETDSKGRNQNNKCNTNKNPRPPKQITDNTNYKKKKCYSNISKCKAKIYFWRGFEEDILKKNKLQITWRVVQIGKLHT